METSLLLAPAERVALWRKLIETIEDYTEAIPSRRVTPELDPAKLRAMLAELDFERPMNPLDALDFASRALADFQVHTPHPRYYGLFNPAPTTMGIAADALVAAFNPQMAAWSHSPFPAEAEAHLVRAFGRRFGYQQTDGTFCSGGAEANHTGMLAALVAAFPQFPTRGLRTLAAQPVCYVSREAHHSFLKAAKLCGIGLDAVREVAVDDRLRIRVDALEEHIRRDRAWGLAPFLVVGTAGTTNAGVIDPLGELADVAGRERLWFHVDAAWGGAAALVEELREAVAGLERADSITFDAHKWLSVPMGAGLFLTRHLAILDRTFRTETAYMPREAAGLGVVDPHLHSMQWSRRFIGLKVLLSLMVAGWEGYAAAIRHQTEMGHGLRSALRDAGWSVVNHTPLPVVCFERPGADPEAVAAEVFRSGQAWVSTTLLGGERRVLRACITNFRTTLEDVRALADCVTAAAGAAQPA